MYIMNFMFGISKDAGPPLQIKKEKKKKQLKKANKIEYLGKEEKLLKNFLKRRMTVTVQISLRQSSKICENGRDPPPNTGIYLQSQQLASQTG